MDPIQEQSVEAAVNFERSCWVGGISVTEDSFYTPPPYSDSDPAGKLLKVDDSPDASEYLLPEATDISRIMYLSHTLTGSLVPVSAFVLWPYAPRVHSDGGFPVVAWAHGTSGWSPDCAPSHLRNLWQHFQCPYQLALNGYVVVATDYAGLGVHHDSHGNPIRHIYMAHPAQANDVVFAVQAARAAYPRLSKGFVTIGHSQGGGASWAVAQRQATTPVDGCLGSVAVSPVTRVLDEPEPFRSIIWNLMSEGLKETLPDVDLASVLTPEAMRRNGTIRKLGSGTAATVEILRGADLLNPHCQDQEHVQRYQEMIANGGKALGCPMLAVQGEADPRISVGTVRAAVAETRTVHPEAQIELMVLPGIPHNAALNAGQPRWMDWIAERFAGKPLKAQAKDESPVVVPARPVERVGQEQNWYLKPATEFYHAP